MSLKEYVFYYCRNYRIQVELSSIVPQLTLLLPHRLRFVLVWSFYEYAVCCCVLCVCTLHCVRTWHGVISSAVACLPMKTNLSLLNNYIFINRFLRSVSDKLLYYLSENECFRGSEIEHLVAFSKHRHGFVLWFLSYGRTPFQFILRA